MRLRLVTVAEEAPGAAYFVVEPDGAQLAEVAALGLCPQVDSAFPLAEFKDAFARCTARGKRGKVVLRVRDE